MAKGRRSVRTSCPTVERSRSCGGPSPHLQVFLLRLKCLVLHSSWASVSEAEVSFLDFPGRSASASQGFCPVQSVPPLTCVHLGRVVAYPRRSGAVDRSLSLPSPRTGTFGAHMEDALRSRLTASLPGGRPVILSTLQHPLLPLYLFLDL